MKLLVLDISGSTGWAYFDTAKQPAPLDYGVIVLSKRARDYAAHPWGYYLAAKALARLLADKVRGFLPLDYIVVEETNGARARFTQKFLEYCHYAFLVEYHHLWPDPTDELPLDTSKLIYINTSEWRKVTTTHLTKEEKNQNARLSRHKRKAKAKGEKLDKKMLGIAGRITIKHVAIRRVKELFGIDLMAKEDDIADAILIGVAYINGAKPCTGSEER